MDRRVLRVPVGLHHADRAYYGEQFLEYILFRKASADDPAVERRQQRFRMTYRIVYCALIPFGAMTRVDVVWGEATSRTASRSSPTSSG